MADPDDLNRDVQPLPSTWLTRLLHGIDLRNSPESSLHTYKDNTVESAYRYPQRYSLRDIAKIAGQRGLGQAVSDFDNMYDRIKFGGDDLRKAREHFAQGKYSQAGSRVESGLGNVYLGATTPLFGGPSALARTGTEALWLVGEDPRLGRTVHQEMERLQMQDLLVALIAMKLGKPFGITQGITVPVRPRGTRAHIPDDPEYVEEPYEPDFPQKRDVENY